jgi:hypothetical protein
MGVEHGKCQGVHLSEVSGKLSIPCFAFIYNLVYSRDDLWKISKTTVN